MSMKPGRTVAIVAMAALCMTGLASCSGEDDGEAVDTDITDEPAADGDTAGEASAAVIQSAESDLGTILVNADGSALYGFLPDEGAETPQCTGSCEQTWPPMLADDVDLAEGLDLDIGFIERESGESQVTIGGLPAYTYAPDEPGSVNGQGVGEMWYVFGSDGSLIRG